MELMRMFVGDKTMSLAEKTAKSAFLAKAMDADPDDFFLKYVGIGAHHIYELVEHPTVRDLDGLAASSRNRYLSVDERRRALAGLLPGRAGLAHVGPVRPRRQGAPRRPRPR